MEGKTVKLRGSVRLYGCDGNAVMSCNMIRACILHLPFLEATKTVLKLEVLYITIVQVYLVSPFTRIVVAT